MDIGQNKHNTVVGKETEKTEDIMDSSSLSSFSDNGHAEEGVS